MTATDSTDYSLSSQKASSSVRCPASVKPGPNAYAITGDGDCLAPIARHGDTMICDPDQTPEPGDLITIWWKGGRQQPFVKRLVLGLPPKSWWGMTGDAEMGICFEMLNPPETMTARLSVVDAVHKVIHVIPNGTKAERLEASQ